MTLLEACSTFKNLLQLVDNNYSNILKYNNNIIVQNFSIINIGHRKKEFNSTTFFSTITFEDKHFLEE